MLAAFTLASCNDNEPDNSVTVDLVQVKLEYGENQVWTGCEDTESGAVVCQGVSFSHKATSSPWGVFWEGFCPSRSADVADHSEGNWLENMWSTMSGGGIGGLGTPFFVAYWNTAEGEMPGKNASLLVKREDGLPFAAESVYVNNSTYAYYVMKNGNAFSKQFKQGDWLKVMFYGVTEAGTVTEPVEYYLADYRPEKEADRTMTKDWTMVNLEALNAGGPLSYVYIQMASSDSSGQFGMNTPGFFSMDRFKIRLQ